MQDNFELNGMKIEVTVVGPVQTNCYILSNVQTKQAIVVDPGEHGEEIASYLKREELKPEAILLTHGHFDHIGGVSALRNACSIPVYASEDEKDVLEDGALNCSNMMQNTVTVLDAQFLKDNEEFSIAGFNGKIIATPGHTHGSACYYFEHNKALFSGDTLFLESVGRTDLPTGNSSAIIKSVREKLMDLPEDTYVFTGHGSATSIGYEKKNNPYLGELDF